MALFGRKGREYSCAGMTGGQCRTRPTQGKMIPALEKDSGSPSRSSKRQRNIVASIILTITAGCLLAAYLIFGNNRVDYGKAHGHFDKYYTLSQDCFAAPANPGDRRRDKSHLKVVNFNTEWLFLYGGMGGIRCPAESCPWVNFDAAMHHLERVAELLVKIDADIVHLSEIEDCRVLRALLEAMQTGHEYRAYLISGKDHMTGQNVALLTKVDPKTDLIRTEKRGHYPIDGSKCRHREGSVGVTKHYVAAIDVDDGEGKTTPFVFAGLHLLARPSDKFRCAQREGQAIVLRDLVKSMSLEGQKVVMMGDFNDYDEEAPGIDGRKPLTQVLKVLRESSWAEGGLANAAKLVPMKRRYSCWFDVNQNCRVDGEKELVFIDHILYDAELEVVDAKIYHDLVPMPSCEERISDHWPFSITFKL